MWVWGFSGFCRLRGFAVNPNIRDVKQICFQAPRDYRLLNWDPQDCCNALRCFLPHRTNPREQSRRREAKVLLELDACSWSGRSEPAAQRAAPRGSSSPRGGLGRAHFLVRGLVSASKEMPQVALSFEGCCGSRGWLPPTSRPPAGRGCDAGAERGHREEAKFSTEHVGICAGTRDSFCSVLVL